MSNEFVTKSINFALGMGLIFGLLLMGINVFGLTQSLRKPELGITEQEKLRFVPDEVWSYQDSMNHIDSLYSVRESDQLAETANRIVHKALVHVDWNRVDPESYRQLVPIWENYFLYFLGKFSGLPQFERYHFTDYQRSIQRGIGICGDAASSLSSILDRHQVPNSIISFEGHVIVQYQNQYGQNRLLDPDFGIELDIALSDFLANPEQVKGNYENAGYKSEEVDFLIGVYKRKYKIFDDTFHFMRKRYVFERVSYVMKWLLPLILIGIPVWVHVARSRRNYIQG